MVTGQTAALSAPSETADFFALGKQPDRNAAPDRQKTTHNKKCHPKLTKNGT